MSRTGRAVRRNPSQAGTTVRMQPVGDALNTLVGNLGIKKKLGQYSVLTSWETLVGEQIARVTKAQRMENGILIVSVPSAVWRAELTMRRREIIEKINTKVRAKIVKDIKFR